MPGTGDFRDSGEPRIASDGINERAGGSRYASVAHGTGKPKQGEGKNRLPVAAATGNGEVHETTRSGAGRVTEFASC